MTIARRQYTVGYILSTAWLFVWFGSYLSDRQQSDGAITNVVFMEAACGRYSLGSWFVRPCMSLLDLINVLSAG